jgi:hypothetical protein
MCGENVYKLAYGVIIGCFWIVYAQPVQCEQDNFSSLWLQYSEDENHLKDSLIDINLVLDADNNLVLRAGETDLPLFPDIPSVSRIVTTHEYYLGLHSFAYLPWSLDLGLGYWGKDRELVTHTLYLNPNWHGNDWMLGVNMELRDIDIYTRELPSGQYRFETESFGAGPVLQWYVNNFSLSFFGMWYGYSESPSRLNNLPVLVLGNTRVHTGTLYDWYTGISLQQKFGNNFLALHLQHSVLAIDQSQSDDLAISYGFYVTRDVQMELELGRTYQDANVTIDYASGSLGFYF